MWTLLLLSPVTFIRVSVICTVEPILLPPDHARTPWQLLHASALLTKFATKPSHRQLLPAATSPYGMEAAHVETVKPCKPMGCYARIAAVSFLGLLTSFETGRAFISSAG